MRLPHFTPLGLGGSLRVGKSGNSTARVGTIASMAVKLTNQVVLVVGASSGIGRETAKLFAREGARVMAAARREERLRELQQEMAAEGAKVEFAVADVSK